MKDEGGSGFFIFHPSDFILSPGPRSWHRSSKPNLKSQVDRHEVQLLRGPPIGFLIFECRFLIGRSVACGGGCVAFTGSDFSVG